MKKMKQVSKEEKERIRNLRRALGTLRIQMAQRRGDRTAKVS
jgi:hypothetical protein